MQGGGVFTKVKKLLGGAVDDALVDTIIDMVESQLLMRLGGESEEVPFQLQYILVNVSVARYNQIGDEGKSSMTVEGESASWLTDLFAPYEKDIMQYLDSRDKATSGVRVRFL